jgi:predicted Zn-dependent protease
MDNQAPQNAQPLQAPQEPAADTVNVSDVFSQIAEKIIEQQEAIIGPVAVEQAKQIQEFAINWPQHDVDINGNPQQAIDELVAKYKELFGQIAVQVSREAAASFLAQLPADQQPKSLTE